MTNSEYILLIIVAVVVGIHKAMEVRRGKQLAYILSSNKRMHYFMIKARPMHSIEILNDLSDAVKDRIDVYFDIE